MHQDIEKALLAYVRVLPSHGPTLPLLRCGQWLRSGGKGRKASGAREILDPAVEAEMAEGEKAYKVRTEGNENQ